MEKNSFILYKSFYPPVSFLTLEQKGRLFDAIFRYQIDGIEEIDDDIKTPFLFFLNQFKVDEAKYSSMCEKRREAGRKGGAPKGNQNAKQNKQMLYNETIATKTTRYENENENENENEEYSFDTFWDLYDKKRGDKDKLRKKWEGFSLKVRKSIIEYIPKYKQAQPDKKYRKDPQTFLNNHSWEDELIFENQTSGGVTGQSGIIQKDGFEWNK